MEENNTAAVLRRNLDLVRAPAGLIGLPSPGLLADLPPGAELPRVFSEHAGLFQQFAARSDCLARFGYLPEPGDISSLATVVVFVPKSRHALDMQLALARALLRPQGSLVLVGEKREGVAGGAKQLQLVDPEARKVDSARHCQVWVAHPGDEADVFRPDHWLSWHDIEVAGTGVRVAGLPGIFSEGRLDAGTSRLLESLATHPPAGPVLDFACGAGVIGAWLQKHFPELGAVDGVDVQFQAVACAQHTYQENGVRGEVLASDGLGEPLGRYRTITTNPPFHSGVRNDTSMTERFLREARKHLLPGGELRLVANRFLAYQPLLESCVGPCQTLLDDRKYAVYQARVRS